MELCVALIILQWTIAAALTLYWRLKNREKREE